MLKEVVAFCFSSSQRGRFLFLLAFIALFIQVPFDELIGVQDKLPYLAFKEEWPRILLHLFHTGCLFVILYILYERGRTFFHASPLSWKKEGLAFFLMAFAYWLYWIPLGFDVTDEGRRLAHSWFMYEGLWHDHVDLRMGGHLLKGLWLHILPGPSVLWGRIGYAALKSLMALFAFLILRNAFHKRRWEAFCYAFVAMLAVSIYGGQVINYNNLPVTLMLAAIHLFQLAGDDGRRPFSRKAAFFAGALIPLAILSRFPFIVFLAFPFLGHSMAHLASRSKGERYWPSMGWTGSGILLGVLFVLLLLGATNSLANYWNTIDQKLIEGFFYEAGNSLKSHGHDKASLTALYLKDLQMILRVLYRLFPFFLALGLIARLSGKWRYLVIPVLAMIGYHYLGPIVTLKDWYHGIVALPLGGILFYAVSERKRPPSLFTCYWGVGLFVFSFMGSNNGVINILITGGGLLLIAYALMLLGEGCWTKAAGWKLDTLPVLLTCMLFIPFYVFHKKSHNIYRDGNQKELVEMMGAPSLFGIFSTPARVKKVDGILEEARARITPYQDDLLVVNTAPIFYFLTESPYSFAKHWEMRGKSDRERKRALNGPNAPEHILMMHKDPRIWDWPQADRPCIEKDLPFYKFYVEYLKGPRYRKVFDNGCFSLHNKVKSP